MSDLRLLALACAIALLSGGAVGAAPRVVLVGVDGGSWSVIDRLLAQGRMPNLAALLARGVSAELRWSR